MSLAHIFTVPAHSINISRRQNQRYVCVLFLCLMKLGSLHRLFKKFAMCLNVLNSCDGCLMIGRGLIGCVDPDAISHSVLTCCIVTWRELFDLKKCASVISLKISSGQTVNQQFYHMILWNQWATSQKTLWKSWFIHLDNAHSHMTLSVWVFLVRNSTLLVPQPICIPDVSTADVFLFESVEKIQEKSTANIIVFKICMECCAKIESLLEVLYCCLRRLFW